MEVLLKEGQAGFKDVIMKKDNKMFSMFFMNVGDLYWCINKENPDSLKEEFDIPQSEEDIFELFEELYKDVENARVLDEKNSKSNNNFKRFLTDRNFFNKETKTIEWHSDETYFDSDDIVKIIKEKDNYHIEFTKPEKYEDPYHWDSPTMISIRFRNSGSYYSPFNIIFMRMFQKAQNLEERKKSPQIVGERKVGDVNENSCYYR